MIKDLLPFLVAQPEALRLFLMTITHPHGWGWKR